MKNGSVWVEIDDRNLTMFTNKLKNGEAQQAIQTAIHKTGKDIKKIVKNDADKYYMGGKNWIGSAVGKPQNGTLQCVVPIKGARGGIGQQFPTSGGAYNTNKGGAYGFSKDGGYRKLRTKKGYKLSAKILKGKSSTLPSKLPHQGGNAPFLYKGTAYTRRTEEPQPIVRVVGVAVPQMVINKAREDIEKDIADKLEENIVNEFEKRMK